ncbi:hypothetical protein [Rhizobium mayense]|uniref:Uncharacterized protein n=1 Tax=Rhizobium mayense TaxID=1312184 RepID=A0ABT7JUP5_9HYPH|nr:hypothetical protein [Rhizobium mayense]MDL2400063.1 hypothetical protein [Rhizobium mayense]
MPRVLTNVFRCIWAFAITATAIGIGAAYGWEKHGLVAAIALGFVGLAVSWPFAYSPAAFFQLFFELFFQILGELLTNLI